MKFWRGPHLAIKVLACMVLIPVLAAWVIPCQEKAPLHQGSPAHSDCCGGHSVPCLSSAHPAPQVFLAMTVFHPFDQHFVAKIFDSDIYRPPRA